MMTLIAFAEDLDPEPIRLHILHHAALKQSTKAKDALEEHGARCCAGTLAPECARSARMTRVATGIVACSLSP